MERLNKEWKEAAVLKWNIWKVELNLCWILHPPTEERLNLNEAVPGYMQNGRQNHNGTSHSSNKLSKAEK